MTDASKPRRTRLWCEFDRGPCTGGCYDTDCALRCSTEDPLTAPGAFAPEREERMPEGTQLVLAAALGIVLGCVAALAWPAGWWPW